MGTSASAISTLRRARRRGGRRARNLSHHQRLGHFYAEACASKRRQTSAKSEPPPAPRPFLCWGWPVAPQRLAYDKTEESEGPFDVACTFVHLPSALYTNHEHMYIFCPVYKP